MGNETVRIESGPTRERIVRSSLMFLLFAGGGIWFAYDGWKGYPEANFREHLETLPTEEREQAKNAVIYPNVCQETWEQAKEAFRKVGLTNQRKALEELYGGPPSHETTQAWYYFGPDFRVKIPLKGGRIDQPVPQIAVKRNLDIAVQRGVAIGLGLVSFVVLIHVIRVVTTHLVLDENGLTYRGKGSVAWDHMLALNSERFRKKGWVDLVYSNNGNERKLRLDEYHLARFSDVMAEICSRKGYQDPVELEKSEKAAEKTQA